MRRYVNPALYPLFAVVVVLASGCGRDSVKTYQVDASDTISTSAPAPTATSMPAAMPNAMPDGLPAPDNSGLPKLKYTLPQGWKEKTPTQLRVASFGISESGKSADVSVIPMGGMAGGDLANVNRWRKDVGEPALTSDDELKKTAEPVTIAGQPADLYDVAGVNAGTGDEERIVAAILHTEDTAWFFKMVGDADLVKKNKPAFVALLKSLEFGAPAAPAAMDLSQLPAGHPAIDAGAGAAQMATTPGAAATAPAWDIPPDWKQGDAPQFVLFKYNIQGAGDATAAATVSELDGTGGGLLANVNRWRGQLGQPAITEDDAAKLPTMDAAGVSATVADFTGTDARTGKPARMIGVVLPRTGQTWFYKLTGDPQLVAQQKDAFFKFIQSAKYPAQ
jgi:hypothetical protein